MSWFDRWRRATAAVAFPIAWLAGPAAAQGATPPLLPQLDALCAPLIDARVAVGFAVGIVDGDRERLAGYGRLALGGDAAPDADTVYEIGSISKVFTALLLADAVERSVVALDDPVQRHLPDGVAMPDFEGEPVRLWHLATHTSGLPRMPPDFAPGDPDDPYADYDEAKLHATLGIVRLRNEPGAGYDYSNLGAGLLGHVLVHATGAASYAALLRERITGPLGMADTGIALDDRLRARLAPPHDADGNPEHNWDLAALAGAGGIRSTVRDMLRLARLALHPGDAPLAAAMRATQQPRFSSPKTPTMGLGWHITDGGRTLWHNGQTGGYHGYLAVQPSTGRAVCILANSATRHVDALGQGILRHLAGEEVAPLQLEVPAAVDRAVLARYAGEYHARLGNLTVALGEPGLFAQLTGQGRYRLFPRSETEFFYRVVEASLTFETDADGLPTAAVIHQNGRDTRFERRP